MYNLPFEIDLSGKSVAITGAGGNSPKATCDNETMSPEMLGKVYSVLQSTMSLAKTATNP